MRASPQQLFAFLDHLGIVHWTATHPPLFSVADSQKWRGPIPGAHTKNLLLKDKRNAVVLAVALEDAVIDLKRLHRRLGTGRLSFANAALMRELIGVEPGSVTPFAVINDTSRRVTVVLDEAMMAEPILNYHPLVNTMTTTLTAADLVKFLEATGHRPQIVAMTEAWKDEEEEPGEACGEG